MATLVLDASQILTMAGSGKPRAGAEKDAIGLLRGGAVLIDSGVIAAVGTRESVLAHPKAKGAREIGAKGGVVIPGFVDAHTHPVFAAPRLDDFEGRVAGATYAELAARGGGILSTVGGVRAASESDLAAGLSRRAADFLSCGTTTIEAKSGYGLDPDNELKMLRVLKTVSARGPLEIVPTLLGAHAVPPEYRGRKAEYLDRVCAEMIPRAAAEGLAKFVDIFCEDGYFDLADLEKIASAGAKAGLGLKVHSEQLSRMGSLPAALKRGAVTVDHLDHAADADFPGLAASGTVACLVPGSNYFLNKAYPPARRLLDAGAAVALATDFNPGTCPCWDMRVILSIACTQLRLKPAEALVAATINGAHAAGLGATHGSLEAGKAADLVCLDASDWRELGYWIGGPKVAWTMKRGELVSGGRVKVLLFDVDGTLIRSGGAGRKALNRAGEVLYGVKNCCTELSLAGRTDLYNFGAAYRVATGRKPTPAAVERLHREYLKHLPHYVKTALRNGTYDVPAGLKTLLKRLSRDKRALLGLGTGNMEKGARIKLGPSGFNAYFLFGGYGSDAFHRHALLRKAVSRAKELAREPFGDGDVFVIGDTPLDVAAGKKAGYKTIAVGGGFAEWKDLVASKPDHLARDFRGLGKWLTWLGLN